MFKIISQDGEACYRAQIFDEITAQNHFENLLREVNFVSDRVKIFGKIITTARQVAWFGDQEFNYRYSGFDHHAVYWSETLKLIKQRVEDITQEKFNSCLVNLYHDGSEAMGWHSDDEKTIVTNSTIASVSFGATRRFLFKHKVSKELVEINLEPASLLLMSGEIQRNWLHSLPKMAKVKSPRINLTFRKMVQQSV